MLIVNRLIPHVADEVVMTSLYAMHTVQGRCGKKRLAEWKVIADIYVHIYFSFCVFVRPRTTCSVRK